MSGQEWLDLLREQQRIDREILDLERKLKANKEFREAPEVNWQGKQIIFPMPAGFDPEMDSERIEKEIQIRRQAKELIAKRRAELEEPATSQAVNAAKPIVWLGTGVELARLIMSLFEKGNIQAETKTDALRQAALHFVGKDGKAFKERVLMESERAKRAFEEGKRPKS
jgi:hypothetical protein